MTAFAGSLSVGEQIAQAVRAPYEALVRNDAAAFCGDFTPSVAAKIVARTLPNTTCAAAVAEVFALSAPYQPMLPKILPADWKATNIAWRGNRASALFHYGKQGSASFTLQKIGDRWLIATSARLILVVGCDGHLGAEGCPPGARVLIALIGLVGIDRPPLVPVPKGVRRAGGDELREFKEGRLVFAQTGCEACHRIGAQGNPHPGSALTHVASRLSTRRIERVLIEPSEPMPSFRHLPKAKFHALVRFLSLLR